VKRSRVDPAAASGSRQPKPPPKSAAFIADSDDESGNGMGDHSLAPYPLSSRPRAAAAKAKAAVAAVMEMEDQLEANTRKGELNNQFHDNTGAYAVAARRPTTKLREAKPLLARKKGEVQNHLHVNRLT
jgi:hypothetical protein